MNRFEQEQERIKAIKMFRVVKRALTLDQRSKIKPTLHNPSLLNMSEYRGGERTYTPQEQAKIDEYKRTHAVEILRAEQHKKYKEDADKAIAANAARDLAGGGIVTDVGVGLAKHYISKKFL
jgi:hypothetical protein